MAKIAIIDDDSAIAEMYRVKFTKDGHSVETAGSGAAGLKLVEGMQPDIVLLDIVLPDTTGDVVLEEIRKSKWGKNLKVIILTNADEQIVGSEVSGMDVSDVIVKAKFTPRQVAKRINEILAQPAS